LVSIAPETIAANLVGYTIFCKKKV